MPHVECLQFILLIFAVVSQKAYSFASARLFALILSQLQQMRNIFSLH